MSAYIAGEGYNLCTFTNSRDFAEVFSCLLGRGECIGEDYHIASDEWLTWNEASDILLDVMHAEKKHVIHIPFDEVLQLDLPLPQSLMYERMLHLIFDTSKIKHVAKGWQAKIQFHEGLRMTFDWLYERSSFRRVVPKVSKQMEALDLMYGMHSS